MRRAFEGGKLVISEKPGAPDDAVCVASRAGPAALEPDSALAELERRGGKLDVSSDEGATTWCATLPSTEFEFGIWLAERRVRTVRSGPRSSTVAGAAVTTGARIVALAEEATVVDRAPPPEQVVVSVSGASKAPDVVAAFERVFAKATAEAPVDRPALTIHQTSERLSVVDEPIPSPRARHAWIVGGGDRERAAISMAIEVLANGSASRLHRDLVVRRLLAHSVEPWSGAVVGGGLYGLDFEISTRTSLDRARRFMDAAVKQLRLVGPSRGELRRARDGTERRALLEFERTESRARKLAAYELMLGDARAWFAEIGAVQALIEEDVRKAAHEHFVDARRSTVEVYPPQWPEDDPRLSQYRMYVVMPGDELGDIATRFGVTIEGIAKANDLDVRYRLMSGQPLLIPPAAASGSTGAAKAAD